MKKGASTAGAQPGFILLEDGTRFDGELAGSAGRGHR